MATTSASASQKLAARAAAPDDRAPTGPTIFDLVEKQKPALARALPRHLDADRLTRIIVTEVRRNPKLLQCDPQSLLGACMQAAQLGLEPGPLGLAYLVPYWNNKTRSYDIQFQLGYRGILELARRSGQIRSIVAREVCANDTFEFEYGLDEKLVHKPALADRGEVVAYYGVAHLTDGGHVVHVMSRDDVDKYRARSKASKDGPWVTDYDQMARKTIIRRMWPWLPQSVEIASAVAADEQTLTFDAADLSITPVKASEPAGELEPAPDVPADETDTPPADTAEAELVLEGDSR